jgi:hypothetical protein
MMMATACRRQRAGAVHVVSDSKQQTFTVELILFNELNKVTKDIIKKVVANNHDKATRKASGTE